MRFLTQYLYNLRDAFRSMSRHKSMTVLSIFTIAMTIFFLGAVALILYNAHMASQQVENDLEIVAFCDPSLDYAGLNDLRVEIEDLAYVQRVDFVDKDSALRDLNSRFESDVDLETTLEGENPLPDAFRVQVTDAEYIEVTVRDLESVAGIDSVRYGQDVVQNVVTISQNMRIFTAVLIGFMILGTLFLIHSTISLTVSHRQHEIDVMRYVGATNSYIRMPFFIEGIFIGGLGAGFAVLGLYLAYHQLSSYLRESMPFVNLGIASDLLSLLLLALFLVGLGLGALGSAMATSKYLRS